MPTRNPASPKLFLATAALIGWFALIGQLILSIENRTASLAETLIRFISYFTILTNLLVTLCLTCLWLAPASAWGKFFTRATTLTALTVYITIVGLIYNILLRSIWDPQGLQWLVNELLHSVIPVVFILFWVLFVPKEDLQWKNILPWLPFPALYGIYTMIRGIFVNFYPYPFLDVLQLGYTRVLLNIGGMVVLFLVVSAIYVAIGRAIARSATRRE